MIEVVTIGTELLLGSTIDTNGAWLGGRLAEAGLRVTRRTTVPDDEQAIRDAVAAALRRTGVVICTGGLGPTADDFTKPVVAALYGVELRLDESWLEEVRRRFRVRGIEMPPVNRNQALVPVGASLLPNARGTAPGLVLEHPSLGTTILLPGVPSEMRALTEEHVLPYLVARFGRLRPIVSRTLRTTGIAESAIQERLADILEPHPSGNPTLRGLPLTLAFLPAGIGEDLRLTCWGELDADAGRAALDQGERVLRDRIGEFVYGQGTEDLAAVLGRALRERGLTLAVAESCTGGLIAQRITAVPGSSDYFLGGFITYANALKRQLLGVSDALLREQGAVSEAVARQMVGGAAATLAADCAMAVTGIAGPGGGTPDKPVGTVWIAALTPSRTEVRLHRFGGTRDEIRARAAQAALAMLLRTLD